MRVNEHARRHRPAVCAAAARRRLGRAVLSGADPLSADRPCADRRRASSRRRWDSGRSSCGRTSTRRSASPFYYFAPLPRVRSQSDRLQVLAGGYPIGAMRELVRQLVGRARRRHRRHAGALPQDVRDATTRRPRRSSSPAAGSHRAPGLRFGVGFAHGAYRDAGRRGLLQHARRPLPDANATVFTVEGEYAFRYTRLTGEWVRDRFESTDVAGGHARLLPPGRADADAADLRGVARHARLDAGADRS